MRFVIIIFFTFISISCTIHEDAVNSTISVDNSKGIKGNSFNDFFSDLRIVELESNDQSRLSNSKKVLLGVDSTILILDRSIQKSLRIFDYKGSYRNSITSDAVSELLHNKTEIIDFDVKDDMIYLLLKGYKGLLVYNFDCKYVKTISLQFIANRIKVTKNNDFLVYKTFEASNLEDKRFFNNLMLVDSTGKLKYKKKPFEINTGKRIFFDVEEPLNGRGSELFYTECLNDTIFIFDENLNNKNYLIIDYKIKSIDKGKFKNLEDIQTIFSDLGNKKPTGICYFNNDNYSTSFIFLQNARSCYFLENKLNKKSVVTSYFTVGANDGYLPIPIYSSENNVIGIVDESSLTGIPFDAAKQKLYKGIFDDIIYKGKTYMYFAKLNTK